MVGSRIFTLTFALGGYYNKLNGSLHNVLIAQLFKRVYKLLEVGFKLCKGISY